MSYNPNLQHLLKQSHIHLQGALTYLRQSRESQDAHDAQMYHLSAQEIFARGKRITRAALSRG